MCHRSMPCLRLFRAGLTARSTRHLQNLQKRSASLSFRMAGIQLARYLPGFNGDRNGTSTEAVCHACTERHGRADFFRGYAALGHFAGQPDRRQYTPAPGAGWTCSTPDTGCKKPCRTISISNCATKTCCTIRRRRFGGSVTFSAKSTARKCFGSMSRKVNIRPIRSMKSTWRSPSWSGMSENGGEICRRGN